MIGEPESDRCYFCGGKLASGLATLPFVFGSSVVVIKRVPAGICAQCGEAIMAGETAATVDELLKQVCRSGFEVSIVTYGEPALANC